MQVTSSQCSKSARSTSRSHKKGLSLTSRSKCDSQQKQFCTEEETLQTMVFNPVQTQTSIKFENVHEKIAWLNENSRQTHPSFAVHRKLADMPKITFRYTNESTKDYQKTNIFSGQFSTTINPSPSRGRPMNSGQMRKIVITHSVQTKNLSQSKINPQSLISEANPSKRLIDSRTIDREIFEEKVIAYLPPVDQKALQMNVGWLHKSPEKSSILTLNEFFQSRIEPQNEYRSKVEQNLSPYHLLASSTKKNESKQLSPGIREQGSLQIMSLEKISQVQEFNMNPNEDDGEASFEQTNQSQKESFSVSDQQTNYIDQFSIRVSQPLSLAKQNTTNVVEEVEEKVLGNKFFNFIEIQSKVEHIKSQSKSPSPSKKQKPRKQENVLSYIENRPPQAQQGCSMSGKRNIRRIKEIEKRLQEIISICSNNI